MTYKDIYNCGMDILRKSNIDEYDLDSFYLFEYVFNINKSRYFMIMNDNISSEDLIKVEDYLSCIDKRAKHIPLQHITGVQEFMGLDFIVNDNVLVPRWDTECLVEKVIDIISRMNNTYLKLLDMCTGSGCIAISISKLSNLKNVTATDLSKKALEVAKQNAIKHNVNINFIESDLFESVLDNDFDIIVSNPPYIPTEVISQLNDEVKSHDPYMALDGDEDGLKFYKKITCESKNKLVDGGYLAYEIGHDQNEAVKAIMMDNGFDVIDEAKDLAGHDRVIIGRMNRRNNSVR